MTEKVGRAVSEKKPPYRARPSRLGVRFSPSPAARERGPGGEGLRLHQPSTINHQPGEAEESVRHGSPPPDESSKSCSPAHAGESASPQGLRSVQGPASSRAERRTQAPNHARRSLTLRPPRAPKAGECSSMPPATRQRLKAKALGAQRPTPDARSHYRQPVSCQRTGTQGQDHDRQEPGSPGPLRKT